MSGLWAGVFSLPVWKLLILQWPPEMSPLQEGFLGCLIFLAGRCVPVAHAWLWPSIHGNPRGHCSCLPVPPQPGPRALLRLKVFMSIHALGPYPETAEQMVVCAWLLKHWKALLHYNMVTKLSWIFLLPTSASFLNTNKNVLNSIGKLQNLLHQVWFSRFIKLSPGRNKLIQFWS